MGLLCIQFQSTLPQGERLGLPSCVITAFAISIHAPARGATSAFCMTGVTFHDFNPRSRKGSDHVSDTTIRVHTRFQSTLPQGERPGRNVAAGSLTGDFNPRSRKGSDFTNNTIDTLLGGFQSTLPQGERQDGSYSQKNIRGFQSTLPQGERRAAVITHNLFLCTFQSTLPQGERPWDCAQGRVLYVFQSTLPQGERRSGGVQASVTIGISIHAPARGATSQFHSMGLFWMNFNPRSRKGSDPDDVRVAKILTEFQSTLPQGERPSSSPLSSSGARNFNPRSRKGSDGG